MPNKNPEKTKSALKIPGKYLKPALAVLALAIVITLAIVTSGGSTSSKNNTAPTTACGPYRTDRVVTINHQVFNTEAASSSDEFAIGLSGRPCILPDQAMLFAFKQPGQYPFWMKGMKFPIDIIWISPGNRVVASDVNVQPSTYPQKFVNQKSRPAQYVLEIKANLSRELGIDIDTPVSF
jgi:uncharacterized membrane protein (UPF0127 family)